MAGAGSGPPGWQCQQGHANSPETWRCAIENCASLRIPDPRSRDEVETYIEWSRKEILAYDLRMEIADEELQRLSLENTRLTELLDAAPGATPGAAMSAENTGLGETIRQNMSRFGKWLNE